MTSHRSSEPSLLQHAYGVDGLPLQAAEPGGPLEQASALVAAYSADRRVALDEFNLNGHAIRVSTSFIVLDAAPSDDEHVPMLFETMTFVDGTGTRGVRSTTREDALATHAAEVTRAREGDII